MSLRPEFADVDTPPRRLLWERWGDGVAVVVLVVVVLFLYGTRLDVQPLRGEETRWATAAREMLATGDWVVPRQQGQVFVERPPMTVWLMAVSGWWRGDVDPIAVRLPSVAAMGLTALLIFGYSRGFTSTTTASIAGLVYATLGQVLQIGRLGESEAAFALFLGASLLLWHLGYSRGWWPVWVWSSGFGFAALAALVKGPQAPVYFVAITATYLAFERKWRYLLSWQMLFGGVVFVAIIGAWQIPFYLQTDWPHVVAAWAGLAGDRIHLRGVLIHLVTFPIETFACLLPWSPMLVALAWPGVRARLRERYPAARFLIIAVLVTYPTVWLAAGARVRYFMPLYPLIAVLTGLLMESCATAVRGTAARVAWHRYLLVICAALAAGTLFVGGGSVVRRGSPDWYFQPFWLAMTFAAMAALFVIAFWQMYRRRGNILPVRVAVVITVSACVCVTGLMLNYQALQWNDPAGVVADLASRVPAGTQLFSFTPIEHRFAYYYRQPIVELGWPKTIDDLPADVDYFCFNRHAGDTAEMRAAGRGRTAYNTPGILPFAWEELCAICPDRQTKLPTATTVVLGRVIRPIRAEVSDATKPRATTVSQQPAVQRK